MATEYIKLLEEIQRKVARGEATDEDVKKLAKLIEDMSKELAKKALESPGLSPDEAAVEMETIYNLALITWAAQTALALIAAAIPFVSLGPVVAKAFDAPQVRWILDTAFSSLMLKQQLRLIAPLTRHYNSEYLPYIVDARTALELHKRGLLDDATYKDLMAQWGYSDNEAGRFVQASFALPSLQDFMRMKWRGLTTDEILKAHTAHLGYSSDDIDHMIAIQEPIPGSGDLINFVVKEAFPLADLPDAPAEFKSWMAKQGYAENWSKAYWYAHWRLVPENTVLDLWHRGYITAEEATKYLVLHDFPTFKRPGQAQTDAEMVLEASYSLLPRIDLRFGWFTGTLSEDEMKALYGKYGFKTEDAEKEIKIQKARVLDTYRKDYLSTLRLAYRRGKISAEDFKKFVAAEGFPSEVGDWIVKSEDLRIRLGAGVEASNEERALTAPTLIRLYSRGIIDEARLKTELANLNYSSEEISLLIADANYEKPLEAHARIHIFTVSEVEQFFKARIINSTTVSEMLKDLGYSEGAATMILTLWNREIDEAETKAQAAASKAAEITPKGLSLGDIEARFKKGLDPVETTRSILADLGFVPGASAKILELWLREVADSTPKPPEPIVKAVSDDHLIWLYKNGLLNVEALESSLLERGYTAGGLSLIMARTNREMAEETEARSKALSRSPNVAEGRLMFEQGTIDLPGLRAIVNETNIDKAWVDRVTEATALSAMRSEIEAIVSRWVTLFDEGFIDSQQLNDTILALGLGDKLSSYWVVRAEADRDAKMRKDEKDTILTAYLQDRITREEADSILSDLGMTADMIAAELRIVDIKRIGKA